MTPQPNFRNENMDKHYFEHEAQLDLSFPKYYRSSLALFMALFSPPSG